MLVADSETPRSPSPSARLLRLLAAGAAMAFLIQGGGMACRYLAQILLSRYWSATQADFGVYAQAMSMIPLLAIPATLGMNTGVMRFAAEYTTHKQWGLLRGFVRQSRLMVLGAGSAIGLAAAGIIAAIWYGQPGVAALLMAMAGVPLFALMELQKQMTRAMHHMALAFFPAMMLQPLLLIALAGGAFAMAGEPIVGMTLVQCLVGSFLLVIVVQMLCVHQVLPGELREHPPSYKGRFWLKESFPMLLVSWFMMMPTQVDVVLVGRMVGDAEAAVYFAASRTAQLTAFCLVAVNAIVGPNIARMHAQDDHAGMQRLTTYAVMLMVVPTLVITVLLAVFAEQVLGLFGPDYARGYWPLMILMLGQLINSATGPVGLLLTLSGRQQLSARVYGWSALLHLAINLTLIPLLGMVGAAIASGTIFAVSNIWLAWLVRMKMDINSIAWLMIWQYLTQGREKDHA